jgi:phage/plasmid-like protein (TIGR03299 family)
MAHELSMTNGTAHFADSLVDSKGRVDAWHKLGTPVGHAMNGLEALDAAHLARWNVRKRPIWVDLREEGSPEGVKMPRQYGTIFTNPINGLVTPIGVVGERYTIIQPESLAEFGDAVIDEIGMQNYVCAGSLYDFSQVFLVIKLPATMVFEKGGKKDVTEWYLVLFNSYDGSSSMFGVITNIRVVCANTARAALRSAKSKFSIRHTNGWRGYVQQAREALGLSWKYEEAFEAEARALFEAPFSHEDAKLFTEDLVELRGVEESDHHMSAFVRRHDTASHILKLFVESPTIKGTPIELTKWGAFNAVTEYVDHFSNVRSSSRSVGVSEDILRANRTLTLAAAGGGLKDDAWRILTTN